MANKQKRKYSQAMAFVLLFGIVSLFSDMTHEGASSIRGAYLTLLGASAGTIGFISGLGELVGYSMRYVFGKLTDKTRHYWTMTIVGYVLDVLAVPALALVGEHGWVWACALLVIQRMGKAIKKPAKDTILSFAASQEGVGKSFGIQEVLDQIGAFLGPVLLYLVMLFKTDGTTFQVYSTCFAVLAIPGAITLVLLLVTKRKFPNPEHFEPEPKEYVPFKMKRSSCSTSRASACSRSALSTIRSCSCTSRARIRTSPPALRRRPRSSAAGHCRCCMPGLCWSTPWRRWCSACCMTKGRAGARVVDGALGAVCCVRVRVPQCRRAARGHRALGRRHGRAGVDFEGRRHADGAQGQPRHRLRRV